jgi:orotidine-5'-phosphate decarboxylase
MKNANPSERLIVALDVPTKAEAQQIVGALDGLVTFYKVGFQLFIAEGMSYVRELIDRGNKVFLDLKMDDVEETITSAVREITRNGVHLLTLHGNGATARAAIAGRGSSEYPKVLSVTLLSSLDGQDLIDLQILGKNGKFSSLMDYVLWRADQAVKAGCDGLIASGDTISEIRSRLGPDPLIISPGIRPAGIASDDHKRAATPMAAIQAGADYLVVGRPIRNAADPADMARRIIGDIEQAYQPRA